MTLAASDEQESIGEATIYRDDLAGARRQALLAAQQEAIRLKLQLIVDSASLSRQAKEIQRRFYESPGRFLVSYRVLEEVTNGAIFHLRLYAKVNVTRLRSELGAMGIVTMAAEPAGKSAQAGTALRLGLWWQIHGTDEQSLKKEEAMRLLEESLKRTSLSYEKINAPFSEAVLVGKKTGANNLLVIHLRLLDRIPLNTTNASEMKGCFWRLHGKWSLQKIDDKPEIWLEQEAVRQTTNNDDARSCSMLATELLDEMSASVNRALTVRYGQPVSKPSTVTGAEGIVLQLLPENYYQVELAQRLLCTKILSQKNCLPNVLSRNGVWFYLSTNLTAANLAVMLKEASAPTAVAGDVQVRDPKTIVWRVISAKPQVGAKQQ